MKTLLSEQADTPSLKIRGRMLPYEEFTARLKNLCSSFGFNGFRIEFLDTSQDRIGAAERSGRELRGDAVVVLSCRVSYNPSWGSCCGLPQQLVRDRYQENVEHCPASFIAPFLQQYRYAQEHVYLTETEPGQHLVTIPENLLDKDGGLQPGQLVVDLTRVAEADGQGQIAPILTNGTMCSFRLSSAMLHDILKRLDFPWKTGRSIPIGRYLESDLFTFKDVERAVAHDNPFYATLLPHLGRIVSHRTPNLLAAEIHLEQEFSRAISASITQHCHGCSKVLCLAGLDIDMAVFQGHEGHYFVPWKAYIERISEQAEEEFALEQDDLYMRLMQQDRQ